MSNQNIISTTIFRLAVFKLRRFVATQTQMSAFLSSANEKDCLDIIDKWIQDHREIKNLITLIYAYQFNQMSKVQRIPQKIKEIAKKETQKIVIQVIKFHFNTIKTEDCQPLSTLSMQKKIEGIEYMSPAFNNDNISKSVQSIFLSSPEFKAKESQEVKSVLQYEEIDPLPAMSPIEMQDEWSQFDEFEQSWKIAEQQSARCGHFLYGDSISQIQKLFNVKDKMFGIIKWKQRESEDTPKNSVIDIDTIRQHSPRDLALYLRKHTNDLFIGKS